MSTKPSSPAAQLIDEKGGPAVFAAAIGKEPGAVRMMKHRGSLPRSVWPEIQRAFPDVTLEVLLKTEEGRDPTGGDRPSNLKRSEMSA
jgi:hypothetical protein